MLVVAAAGVAHADQARIDKLVALFDRDPKHAFVRLHQIGFGTGAGPADAVDGEAARRALVGLRERLIAPFRANGPGRYHAALTAWTVLAKGLPADDAFRRELDALRAEAIAYHGEQRARAAGRAALVELHDTMVKSFQGDEVARHRASFPAHYLHSERLDLRDIGVAVAIAPGSEGCAPYVDPKWIASAPRVLVLSATCGAPVKSSPITSEVTDYVDEEYVDEEVTERKCRDVEYSVPGQEQKCVGTSPSGCTMWITTSEVRRTRRVCEREVTPVVKTRRVARTTRVATGASDDWYEGVIAGTLRFSAGGRTVERRLDLSLRGRHEPTSEMRRWLDGQIGAAMDEVLAPDVRARTEARVAALLAEAKAATDPLARQEALVRAWHYGEPPEVTAMIRTELLWRPYGDDVSTPIMNIEVGLMSDSELEDAPHDDDDDDYRLGFRGLGARFNPTVLASVGVAQSTVGGATAGLVVRAEWHPIPTAAFHAEILPGTREETTGWGAGVELHAGGARVIGGLGVKYARQTGPDGTFRALAVPLFMMYALDPHLGLEARIEPNVLGLYEVVADSDVHHETPVSLSARTMITSRLFLDGTMAHYLGGDDGARYSASASIRF